MQGSYRDRFVFHSKDYSREKYLCLQSQIVLYWPFNHSYLTLLFQHVTEVVAETG